MSKLRRLANATGRTLQKTMEILVRRATVEALLEPPGDVGKTEETPENGA